MIDLPMGFALYKTETGWGVSQIDADYPEWGNMFEHLATAPTIEEAIADAHAEVARREQAEAERAADYQRRKAEGKLNPYEQMSEMLVEDMRKSYQQALLKALPVWIGKGDDT